MEILKKVSNDLLTNTSESLNPYRDQIIEEVAQHIAKMKGFGQDTIDSLCIYIRSLK